MKYEENVGLKQLILQYLSTVPEYFSNLKMLFLQFILNICQLGFNKFTI